MRSLPGTIIADLPCLRCGYDLRTLAADARCPECNYEVFLTLHGGLPIIDTRARRLALAAACLALAVAMATFTCLVRNRVGYNTMHAVWTTDPAWVYLPVGMAWLLGMALFACPQHHLDGRPLSPRSRRVILAAAPAPLLSIALWEYAYAWVRYDRFDATRPLLYVPLLAVAPGVLLELRLLGRLLRPLGLGRFRWPLRVVVAVWWLIAPFATLVLLSEIPGVGRLWDTHWRPFAWLPQLPHVMHELLERVEFLIVIGVYFAYLAGIGVLGCLGLALVASRPRDVSRYVAPAAPPS
jgi:hypothetical protein